MGSTGAKLSVSRVALGATIGAGGLDQLASQELVDKITTLVPRFNVSNFDTTWLNNSTDYYTDTDVDKQLATRSFDWVGKTPVFASSKRIVDRVPALQQVRDLMDAAPVGTKVPIYVGPVGLSGTPIIRVYQKTSPTSWQYQEIEKIATGNVIRKSGGLNKFGSGWFKPLQSMYDTLYRGTTQASILTDPKVRTFIKTL